MSGKELDDRIKRLERENRDRAPRDAHVVGRARLPRRW
jgi:hypothetical protein